MCMIKVILFYQDVLTVLVFLFIRQPRARFELCVLSVSFIGQLSFNREERNGDAMAAKLRAESFES